MLKWIGTRVLILWVIRDMWVYGGPSIRGVGGAIGSVIGDLRVWALGIGVVVLWIRDAKRESKGEQKADPRNGRN